MITGNESLLFDPRFMDPQAEPYGLFWCANAEDVQAIQINAVCKRGRSLKAHSMK